MRTERWKYIRRYDEATSLAMSNCDNSITKTFMMARGWRERPVKSERLYNLVFDPYETNNLAKDERHEDVLTEMRSRLERWREETNDPLLKDGIMIPPETAVVNDPKDLSPSDLHYSAREFLGI